MYDLRYKYRVMKGQDVEYVGTLAFAKLIAGEWQLDQECTVEIVRQQGRMKRWKATLEPSGDVRLDELYSDGTPDDRLGQKSGHAKRMAALIDREEARRNRRKDASARAVADEQHERSQKFGRGVKRAVVCLSTDPPRRFEQASDAARWLGVKHQSFFRSLRPRKNGARRKCCGMVFAYEDELGGSDGRVKQASPGTATARVAAKKQCATRRQLPLEQGAQPALPVR